MVLAKCRMAARSALAAWPVLFAGVLFWLALGGKYRELWAYQSLNVTFAEERGEAEQSGKLGPMLPDDYREARRIFLEDLAAR